MKLSQLKNLIPNNQEHSPRASQTRQKSARRSSKEELNKWFSVSIDLLELHIYQLVVRPFVSGFGVLFGFGITLGIISLIAFGLLYSNNYELLINQLFLTIALTALATVGIIVAVIVHAITTVQRFTTLHEILPHQKYFDLKNKWSLIVFSDLISIFIFIFVASLVVYTQERYIYTSLLFSFSVAILLFRTLFKYSTPLMLFEQYPLLKSVRESIVLFFSSDIRSINHTLIPTLSIFGIGIASTSLIERTQWGVFAGLIVIAIYISIYFLYYYFFGFTIDYLAYVYARVKSRMKPKLYFKDSSKQNITLRPRIISGVLFAMLPVLVFSSLYFTSNTIITNTQEVIIMGRLRSEVPQSLTTRETQQPFSPIDTIEYRNIEFSVNSLNILEIESEAFSNVCLAEITIKNLDEETFQFFPHLTVDLNEVNSLEEIPHYIENTDSLESSTAILDSYTKYVLPQGLSLNGALPFDCSNVTGQNDLVLAFNMVRVVNDAVDANLTIPQFIDFSQQSGKPEFQNAQATFLIESDDFNSQNISQSIPLDLTINSKEIITQFESRFCRINYTINNSWREPIDVEFFMITLTDGNGTIRPQAFIEDDFNPESLNARIAPDESTALSQDFNCQDGGNTYDLEFNPFFDFGPYITENSVKETLVF
jgi:hypothetical protein